MRDAFVVGTYYVFSIPPGWLIAGKVETHEGKRVYLSEAAYIELSGQTSSPVSDLAYATTAKEMREICQKSWPMRAGTSLHEDGILMAIPCEGDLSTITRARDVATIKGAK